LSLICDEVVTIEYDIKNIANYSNRELLYNQNKEHFIYGSSIDESVINKAKSFGEFDAVFIDGNHSYEYVKSDWENYSKLVKKDGIVAFHDACLDADRYGTPKVLSEIRRDIILIKHSKEVGIAYYIND
jgi:predicted O-methyltransferase YrrM